MELKDVPYGYAVCYAKEEQCTLSRHCLRSEVAKLSEQQPAPPHQIVCVTPAYVKRVAKGQTCEMHQSDVPVQYAKGMKSLFDAVPKGIYPELRDAVMRVFGTRRNYFYARSGERLITPEQQNQVEILFKAHHLSVPTFDGYEMDTAWE